jgi:hypothetical protein
MMNHGDDIAHKFASHLHGETDACSGIMGAIGAQEALKAASGLYSPIRQFLLYVLRGDID